VAIRIIPKENFETADFSGICEKIAEILPKCESPFTSRLYGICEKQNEIWIITQFIDGGSVFDLVFIPFSPFYVVHIKILFKFCR
jgi:hypothetical protein